MNKLFFENSWCIVKDGDPVLRYLLNRHYSARKYHDNRRVKLSAGPGKKLCLLTSDGLAAFIWRIFISDIDPPQEGVNCALFRNEGQILSSRLILEAEELAVAKWPEISRFWTIVNHNRTLSPNAGYCFKVAGWKRIGLSKGGLTILAKEL